MIQPHEARRDLSLRIGDQLFIDLHLAFVAEYFVVWLKYLFASRRIVKEFSGQHLVAHSFDDRAHAIGAARSPDYFVLAIQHFEREKGAAKSDAGRETMSGEVFDLNGRLQIVVLST